MKCPVDNTELIMSERTDIEIDYCPQCRGVWLDRGELDKIIERSDTYQSAGSDGYRHKYDRNEDEKQHKGSFVGDIFGKLGR